MNLFADLVEDRFDYNYEEESAEPVAAKRCGHFPNEKPKKESDLEARCRVSYFNENYMKGAEIYPTSRKGSASSA